MIRNDLLVLLRCPQTFQPLSLADPTLLAEVNARRAREANASGNVDEDRGRELIAGLVREDCAVMYPVQDGIPLLLAEHAIRLPVAATNLAP